MPTNFYMLFIVALVPLVVGAIYYNPKVLGNAWMKVNGFTAESLQGGNMVLTFILSYVFGLFLSFFLPSVVMHQGHLWSLMMPEVMESGSAVQNEFAEIMTNYGDRYRSFGHGALHATVLAVMIVLPIIAILAMFERRGWKYILIHWVYWLICLIIMGGVLCATLQYELPT